jgi:hypothetical protein
MFFVVSTGRSGTQTMADLLNQSPDAGCFHEPEPRLIAESTRYLYGDLPHPDAVELLRRTRPTIPIDREYGEAHHQISYMIPALHDAFPEAKFIWLIRDGRTTVASMVARRWYTGRHFSPYPIPMIWETWRIRADRLGEMSTSAWLGLSPFEKCCWQWAYKNRLIECRLNECGGAWMFVHLEELDARAGELFDFLGIRRPETITVPQLNKAKNQDGHIPVDWHNWNAEQVSAFMRMVSAVARRDRGRVACANIARSRSNRDQTVRAALLERRVPRLSGQHGCRGGSAAYAPPPGAARHRVGFHPKVRLVCVSV